MDGREIKRLREARGLTQPQLAQALRVGPRTIGNWESGSTVPKNRLGMIRQFFGTDAAESADPLRVASDVALAAEILRRAIDRQTDPA